MNQARQRALVTGATGFVGSHLVRRLLAEDFDVAVLTRPGSALDPLSPFVERLQVIEHDGSTDSLIDLIGDAGPDIVFHLASRFIAEHRPGQVVDLIDSNVRLGAQLMEAMAVSGCRSLVNAGTSWQHFNSSGYRPVCLYAATKQAFDALVDFYVDAQDLRAITLKLFDTYGPDDRRPKLFALLQKSAESGAVLELSAGEQLIDLVFIDDVVDALLMAAARLIQSSCAGKEEFAVSSGSPISLRDLVGVYQRVSGANLAIRWGARPYRRREVMVPWSGGLPIPGWKPQVRLEEGIARVVRQQTLCEAP